MQFTIRIDTIRKSESLFQMAAKIEQEVKADLIK
jgi:hypothetical protein